MYKTLQISKEEYKKCEVKIIDKERYFWVNRKDLAVKIQTWISNTKFQQYGVFIRNDLVGKKVKAVENHQKDF